MCVCTHLANKAGSDSNGSVTAWPPGRVARWHQALLKTHCRRSSGLTSDRVVDWTASADHFQSDQSSLLVAAASRRWLLSLALLCLFVVPCHLSFLTSPILSQSKQTSLLFFALLHRPSEYLECCSTWPACLITIDKRSLARKEANESRWHVHSDVDWRWLRQTGSRGESTGRWSECISFCIMRRSYFWVSGSLTKSR